MAQVVPSRASIHLRIRRPRTWAGYTISRSRASVLSSMLTQVHTAWLLRGMGSRSLTSMADSNPHSDNSSINHSPRISMASSAMDATPYCTTNRRIGRCSCLGKNDVRSMTMSHVAPQIRPTALIRMSHHRTSISVRYSPRMNGVKTFRKSTSSVMLVVSNLPGSSLSSSVRMHVAPHTARQKARMPKTVWEVRKIVPVFHIVRKAPPPSSPCKLYHTN
mmetsp:Transcript_52157/g.138043  ORF Transcript_52157/g.138043 Transcript_52157/m.138043 type:complete len:219 (-) Transcript_52157:111-767(-)